MLNIEVRFSVSGRNVNAEGFFEALAGGFRVSKLQLG
jgi:hypothetical protein